MSETDLGRGVDGAAGVELLAPDEVEPPRPGRRPGATGVWPLLRWGWRQLTAMRTALVLLFLLAVASIPGSLLPQRPRNPGDVSGFFKEYPTIAPILDRLWLFDVFASPWFAAIYLLLAISLVGCIVPRTSRHLKAVRARPPRTPRNLGRLPVATQWVTDETPEQALARAESVLGRKRFRMDTTATTVAAEKGYLKETGNLVFHTAVLSLLFAVAAGALFGYSGRALVVEGEGFANTRAAYNSFDPGRFVGPASMQPFILNVEDFRASYIRSGPKRGQPRTFEAGVTYRATPGGEQEGETIEVNHPLVLNGTKVYLLDHGYAPTFTVRDGNGNIAFRGPVPFLSRNPATYTSDGVIKAPDAKPEQLAFAGIFTPTTMPSPQGPTSVFPAAVNPAVTLLAYSGELVVSSGTAKSLFDLDTGGLTRVKSQQLTPGQTMTLPDGLGSITFTGYREWAGLQITDDPAKLWVLISAVLVLAGLILTLGIRRRRVWVRAGRESGGRTVVDVGGLTRGDGARGFDEEFSALADAMRGGSRSREDREDTE